MRRAAIAHGLILLSVLAVGCAENAILELELQFPPQTAASGQYVVIQALSSETALTPGMSLGSETTPFTLAEETIGRMSLVASGAEITQPLYVGVRFCVDRDCLATGDPQEPDQLFRLERAFYLGAYSSVTIDLRGGPTPGLTEVGRCEVHGCFMGSRPVAGSCLVNEDGTEVHFCEGD